MKRPDNVGDDVLVAHGLLGPYQRTAVKSMGLG